MSRTDTPTAERCDAAGIQLRTPDGVAHGPFDVEELYGRACRNGIPPGSCVSSDGDTWVPPEDLPDLHMEWTARAEDGTERGPFNLLATPLLVKCGAISREATAVNRTSGHSFPVEHLLKATETALETSHDAPATSTADAGSDVAVIQVETDAAPTPASDESPVALHRREVLILEQLLRASEDAAAAAPSQRVLSENRQLQLLLSEANRNLARLEHDTRQYKEDSQLRERELHHRISELEEDLRTATPDATASEEAPPPRPAIQGDPDHQARVTVLQTSLEATNVLLHQAETKIKELHHVHEVMQQRAADAHQRIRHQAEGLKREAAAATQSAENARAELAEAQERLVEAEDAAATLRQCLRDIERRLRELFTDIGRGEDDKATCLRMVHVARNDAAEQRQRRIQLERKTAELHLAGAVPSPSPPFPGLSPRLAAGGLLAVVAASALTWLGANHIDRRAGEDDQAMATPAVPAPAAPPEATASSPLVTPRVPHTAPAGATPAGAKAPTMPEATWPQLEMAGITVATSQDRMTLSLAEGAFSYLSILKPDAERLLATLAPQLRPHLDAGFHLIVEGFTDATHTRSDADLAESTALRSARAQAVRDILCNEHGLPASAITPTARAMAPPPYANDEANRRRNRTVVLYLVRKASSNDSTAR